jgi:hypothetical protein
MFCRINLSCTNYSTLESVKILVQPDYNLLKNIYQEYCKYKKFTSIMPFLKEEYQGNNKEILGYYDKELLVAYSLIVKCPSEKSVLSDQFAWNYHRPKLRLGIRSIEHECAFYKNLGYEYLYLGNHAEYKSKFQGYELLGNDFCLQETT